MNAAQNTLRLLVQPYEMIPESIYHKASKFSDALERLSYPEMSVRDTVVRDAYYGTLAWVTDRSMPLGKWLQAGTGVFWVKGKPGSGKSTLMRHLHQISKPRSCDYGEATQCDHSMAFFFSNSGAPIERSAEGLLRFMLYQLLASAPTRYVKIRQRFELWFIDGKDEMSKEKLQYLISEFLDGEGNLPSFLIFIDALDECEMLTREDVSFLQALGTKFALKVRFCVSSRPSAMLSAQLIHAPQCDVNETAPTDIAIYVKSRLRAACDSDPGIFLELSGDIVQSASGVFLWVKLVVEELSRGFDGGETVEELRARLSKIPSELNQYFRCMFDRIDATYRRDTVVAINIICTAIRPLSVNEFRYALMLGMTLRARDLRDLDHADWAIRTNTEMQKRLLTCCGGFAEIVNDEVRLIHYSIKEFFTLGDSTAVSGSLVNVVDSQIPQHQFLLRSCTRYLCLPELKATEDTPGMDMPLLMYAIQYWFMHYREANADGSLNLSEIWRFFDPAQKHFQNWDRLYSRSSNLGGRHDDKTNVICFAAQHNLSELMEALIAAGVDVNIPGGELGRPLQAAAVEGHVEMARLLVDNGADVNAEGGRFGTAMAAAITLKNRRMIDS
jgi:energy-coupling factor transporter ATP-binding protein EcfA2